MAIRTAERHHELRLALVDAAERAIAGDGLAGVKARELATAAGCSLGAIYTVFPNLDALIFAVNGRTLAAIAAFIEEQLGEVGLSRSPRERAVAELVRLAVGYLDYAAGHTPRWRALFDHRMSSADAEIPSWYAEEQVRLFSRIEAPLAELRPDLSEDRRRLFARTLFSGVHGIISLGLDAKLAALRFDVLRDEVRDFVAIVGAGLDAFPTGPCRSGAPVNHE